MSLISLVVLIAFFGLIVWAITSLVPMPEAFKNAIYVVAVVCLAVYMMQTFGFWNGVMHVRLK